MRNGTGRHAALDGFAAGKRGASEGNRDAWFVDFTDQLVVGIWVGNDHDTPMPGVTGGDLPARIWQAFIAEATGLAPVELEDVTRCRRWRWKRLRPRLGQPRSARGKMSSGRETGAGRRPNAAGKGKDKKC